MGVRCQCYTSACVASGLKLLSNLSRQMYDQVFICMVEKMIVGIVMFGSWVRATMCDEKGDEIRHHCSDWGCFEKQLMYIQLRHTWKYPENVIFVQGKPSDMGRIWATMLDLGHSHLKCEYSFNWQDRYDTVGYNRWYNEDKCSLKLISFLKLTMQN